MKRIFYRPTYLPTVWVRENADGTGSWPSQAVKGAWMVIRTPQDYPPAYLHPPRSVSPVLRFKQAEGQE